MDPAKKCKTWRETGRYILYIFVDKIRFVSNYGENRVLPRRERALRSQSRRSAADEQTADGGNREGTCRSEKEAARGINPKKKVLSVKTESTFLTNDNEEDQNVTTSWAGFSQGAMERIFITGPLPL